MLTKAEQAQLLALITREGGLAAFSSELTALFSSSVKTNVLAQMSAMISVTVADWIGLSAAIAAGTTPFQLFDVVATINAAVAAKDASQLGPLFVQLYMTTIARR